MKIIRRKKKYYLQIITRIMVALACGVICVGIGVLFVKLKYERSSQEQEAYLCVLKQGVEAGDVLKESDVKQVTVLNKGRDLSPIQIEECIGKQVKVTLKEGAILSDDLICEKDDSLTNLRKISYEYVKNTDVLNKGDFIDVRISFPNGADFILLSKKEVVRVQKKESSTSQELWMALTEEEILRMSSGVVDAYLFDGAYIYATIYLNQMQEESIVNYPVNEVVEELIKKDPNIVLIAQNQKTLELRSKIYENVVNQKEKEVQIQEEELMYFE